MSSPLHQTTTGTPAAGTDTRYNLTPILLAVLIGWLAGLLLVVFSLGRGDELALSIGSIVATAGPILFAASRHMIPRALRSKDSAYLYFLGISGVRMFVYLGVVGVALWQMPVLVNTWMILGLTLIYLMIAGVEVWVFVRNLHRD